MAMSLIRFNQSKKIHDITSASEIDLVGNVYRLEQYSVHRFQVKFEMLIQKQTSNSNVKHSAHTHTHGISDLIFA